MYVDGIGGNVAAAGGVVIETSSFDVILANFHSIWVKASPKEHLSLIHI